MHKNMQKETDTQKQKIKTTYYDFMRFGDFRIELEIK